MSESDNRMEMTALEYIVEAQAVKLKELMSVEEYEQFVKETARGAFRASMDAEQDTEKTTALSRGEARHERHDT